MSRPALDLHRAIEIAIEDASAAIDASLIHDASVTVAGVGVPACVCDGPPPGCPDPLLDPGGDPLPLPWAAAGRTPIATVALKRISRTIVRERTIYRPFPPDFFVC